MVNGLDNHPLFRDVARSIRLNGLPDNIQTFEDRLTEEYETTTTKPNNTPIFNPTQPI